MRTDNCLPLTFVFEFARDALFWLRVVFRTLRIWGFTGSGDVARPCGLIRASGTVICLTLSSFPSVGGLFLELIVFITVPTTSGVFSVFRSATCIVSVFPIMSAIQIHFLLFCISFVLELGKCQLWNLWNEY